VLGRVLALPEVGLPAAWPPFSRSISFCISLIFDVRPGIFVSILESVGTHSTGQAMLTSGLPKNAQQLQPPIPDKRGGGGGGGTSFFFEGRQERDHITILECMGR